MSVLNTVVSFFILTSVANVVIVVWALALAILILLHAYGLAKNRKFVVLDHIDLALVAFSLLPVALFRLSILLNDSYTLAVVGSRIGNIWSLVMLSAITWRHYLIVSNGWQTDE